MKILIRYLIPITILTLAVIDMLMPSVGIELIQSNPLMALGIASSAIKGVSGIAQMLRGRPEEVKYDIPSEVFQSLDMARTRARGESPMFRTQKENLESQTATMARRATELGGPGAIGALSHLQANQMAGTREIDMAEEQYQLTQEERYMRELQNVAKFRDREFELNELQTNEREWNEYYNSKTAGMQNLMGSMDTVAGLAGTAMGQKGIDAELEKILGGGAGAETPQFNEEFMGDPPKFDFSFEDPKSSGFDFESSDPWQFSGNQMAGSDPNLWG